MSEHQKIDLISEIRSYQDRTALRLEMEARKLT
jgi:hypothetical protein